ncbi:steroid delta-isomerase domain protein [Chytriomyces sp. MP71]|nr:steroid delta-isomerase domain protein [Chytriomyces sp. MP71]
MSETTEAEQLAQRQLEAYNAHDIVAFAACYAPDIEVLSFPSNTPRFAAGIEIFRERYGSMFASFPNVHARLVKRVVHGDKCIDEEEVTGRGEPIKAIAMYWVKGGLIRKVWFMEDRTDLPNA